MQICLRRDTRLMKLEKDFVQNLASIALMDTPFASNANIFSCSQRPSLYLFTTYWPSHNMSEMHKYPFHSRFIALSCIVTQQKQFILQRRPPNGRPRQQSILHPNVASGSPAVFNIFHQLPDTRTIQRNQITTTYQVRHLSCRHECLILLTNAIFNIYTLVRTNDVGEVLSWNFRYFNK